MATQAKDIRSDFAPEVRARQIGGTDAGVIAGYNRFKSPFILFQEKKGFVEPPRENTAMKTGIALEPVVAEMYLEAVGNGHALIEPDAVYHPDHEFIVGHLDRIVKDPAEDKIVRGLEIKTTSPFNSEEWGAEWSDEIPRAYLAQVMHYMGITGIDHFDVAVLIGNSDFRIYRVHKSDDMINALFELELDFWKRLQEDNPPDVDSSKKAAEYLNQRYPKDSGLTIEVTEDDKDILEILQMLADAQEKKKLWENTAQGWKNKVMNYMGEASRLVCPFGSVSWKQSKDRDTVDWPKLAADLEIDAETVAKYTETKPGPRTFRPNLKLEGVK